MSDAAQPKAFISHATEDKDRFVIRFATELRSRGVDAWVDEWEIRAGDSLVDKVFAHGIDRASVFIVVLSEISITKPWVREELDAGMMRRIGAGTKAIPVLLDEVSVPAALQHLRYVSVPRLGFEGTVDDVLASVFGHPVAPPLGAVPGYSRRLPQLVPDPTDDAVFAAIVDLALETGNTLPSAQQLLAHLPGQGLTVELVEEAIGSLKEKRIVETESTFGGEFVKGVRPRHWLRAVAARGTNVDALHDQLLVHLVNHSVTSGFDAADTPTLEALLEVLHTEGLIERPQFSLGGSAWVRATVAGQRRARQI